MGGAILSPGDTLILHILWFASIFGKSRFDCSLKFYGSLIHTITIDTGTKVFCCNVDSETDRHYTIAVPPVNLPETV